jgi:hypothetical protein
MEISPEEVAERQEEAGVEEQTEDAGRSSSSLESLVQAYARYEGYADAGPSDETKGRMERLEEEAVHQSPSPDPNAGAENQIPELSAAARADLAVQTENYQGEPIPQKPPLDTENTPLYSGTQRRLTKKYSRLGPLASRMASARTLIYTNSLTKVAAEKEIYKMVYKTSPPLTENDQLRLNHRLRQTVGNLPHEKILEQLDKGAQPAATSSVHQQNAFHKLAASSGPRRRTTDALIQHTPPDKLSRAAIARDHDGKTAIEIAHEKLDKAIEKGDEVQRVRLTHLIGELAKAAAAAQPVQDFNEPHQDEERKRDDN